MAPGRLAARPRIDFGLDHRGCPQCGAPLRARAVEGLCPKCLLKLALVEGAGSAGDSAGPSPTEAQPAPQASPERIGPYRILQVLGEGGVGIVYLAEQV